MYMKQIWYFGYTNPRSMNMHLSSCEWLDSCNFFSSRRIISINVHFKLPFSIPLFMTFYYMLKGDEVGMNILTRSL
jgi:hypothetical protein